ncbi:MAG TPA: hypothetical protein VJ717_03680 [Gemmatimonadaceae bacterium]|nr:hypothetical protein [Gemmatimonadaceae bacterium]
MQMLKLQYGTLLAATLFCAGTLSAQAARARVRLPGFNQIIVLDTLAVRMEIPAPPEEVFPVAAAALEHELKMELTTRDSTLGVVGNLYMIKLRRLGKSALSRYLSCGNGMTGPNADNYRIYMSVAALVDPLPDKRTKFGVAVAAGAQDIQGNAKLPIACGTTGALETEIRRIVGARFGVAVR